MADIEAIEEYVLREVFTRWLTERMGDMKAAEFSRASRISKAELSVIKDGTRKVTEGQVVKVCAHMGPKLSDALSRMGLIARDVESEIAAGGHVTMQATSGTTATLVTASGRKVAIRRESADAAVKTIEAETDPATAPKKKRQGQKRSRPESEQPRSAPATQPHRPSPRS